MVVDQSAPDRTSLALHALAELTGADVSSELLDAIFQRFYIGK